MVAGDAAGSLETLVNDGWNHHDTESERLARELEAAADNGMAAGILASFIHLSVHTIGEHLGDWERALRLGKRALDGHTPTTETAQAWGRLYVTAILAGDPVEAAVLELACLTGAAGNFGAALLDMRFMLAAALVSSRRNANAIGDPTSGLAHADAALAIIHANGERPLDSAPLHLARAVSLTTSGDDNGTTRAIGDADAAASTLTAMSLKAQYAAERAKVAAAD
jgi:hypothetical protein